MRGGALKLVKMQIANAPSPLLSMPSWRRIGVRKKPAKAQSLILQSEEGMMIFVIEWLQHEKELFPVEHEFAVINVADQLFNSP